MDFNLDETQQDLKKLAADVLAKDGDEERLWQAGLMGVCVPEEAGGAGLGPVEMAVVLREVGARAAMVPALPTLASTLLLARHGTPDQQRTGRLTLALREPARALADPPTTTARQVTVEPGAAASGDAGAAGASAAGQGGAGPSAGGVGAGPVAAEARGAGAGAEGEAGWRVSGRKVGVPYPGGAVLVTADNGLFLMEEPVTAAEFTSTGEPAATVVLDGTPAERVAGPEAVADARRIFMAAVAAQASGVLAGALELTTAYIKQRRQFGRALAEFQAVTMQIADVYIAARALDVAMWSAVWRLGEGLPAEEDLALAAYHVSGAFRALYTCQHLHGGLGLDVTYPLHRYFAQARHLSLLLGGADAQLDVIGALV
ncbi:Acyl-CoA dehydrogenase, short-chain specific [[Actinomadura] parvosata subsp. kistnae]|uniref:Acyl-CoA dehydrogenase n=1 Tax=[Actinomadura] parvosata subsp. kistnae TaxID=1909395 RepID=A0A1V0AFL5_9ACTN|nr:acyl-CoA dehydrogenase family protein [Nonomuraea sp. ATCC 55076]AQZ69024.1 acyl-CoA dehydrogenase [Nonomuraea sp. ATCC 55076]SPL92409.1 Acyl-CoA dehydrogenase, short-chain specific [Actinomadura parvosata subsp. kistnae]